MTRYKGRLYGMTYFVDIRLPLYRADMMREAGLPTERARLPKTWDQLRDHGKRLARWEGQEIKRAGFQLPKPGDFELVQPLPGHAGPAG